MTELGRWFYFVAEKEYVWDDRKSGKWMCFFSDQEFAISICEKAIAEGVCCECKCSNLAMQSDPYGAICFYLNCDDIETHKRVIAFMVQNNLIQRTKTGKLYNISFKFDDQTRAGEYGAAFNGEIKLSHFLNLETGAFLI